MSVKQSHYETLLAEYSNREGAIALLRQHRPYMEMIPSMRRADQSLITIPLPVVKIRHRAPATDEAIHLPCDLAIVMCDPEWKIKMGPEILVFIHRPQEDFSHLLSRWRRTQVRLTQDYEWFMPARYQHILSEGAEKICPLFVVFSDTIERIKKGLTGASLPFVIYQSDTFQDEEIEDWQIGVES